MFGLGQLDSLWIYFFGVVVSICWQLVILLIPLQLIYQCNGSLSLRDATKVHHQITPANSNSRAAVSTRNHHNLSKHISDGYESSLGSSYGSPSGSSFHISSVDLTPEISNTSIESKIDEAKIANYIRRAIIEFEEARNAKAKAKAKKQQEKEIDNSKLKAAATDGLSVDAAKQQTQKKEFVKNSDIEKRFKEISAEDQEKLIKLMIKQSFSTFLKSKYQYYIFNAFLGMFVYLFCVRMRLVSG